MSKAAGDPERAIHGIMAVAQLLENPQLARLYSVILRDDSVTIDELIEACDRPRSTVDAETETLVALGVLSRDESTPHTYTAVPLKLTVEYNGNEYTITPTLIEAIGRAPRDRDLNLLLERDGVEKLAAALTYAVPYTDGQMSERVAARELELQPAVASGVLQALREVVLEMREIDPYFEAIRNARDSPPKDG